MSRLFQQRLLLLFALVLAQMGLLCLASSANAEDTEGQSRKISKPTSASEVYFSGLNLESVSVIYQGRDIGKISLYQHLAGTLVPFGALSALMQWPVTIDQGNRVAEGFDPVANQKITIAPAIRTIIKGGEISELVENQIFFHQNDIYLDADVIREKLGIGLELNRNTETLEVNYKKQISGDSALIAAEKAGPRVFVPPPALSDFEGETLVLQIIVNDTPMVEFVDALTQDRKTFLPFASLSEILEFPIKTNVTNVTAEGWFARETNRFSFDGTTAVVKGKSYKISTSQMIRNEENFYFDQALLQEWFSLQFNVDLRKMELRIKSQEPFPFEERLKRQQLYSVLENQKKLVEKQKKYQPFPLPYKALAMPVIDVDTNAIYQKNAERKISNPYYIQGSGDLAYMTSRFYLSGDLSESALGDFRFSLGRDDYKRELLGPLAASSFRFGDINSIGISQVAQTSEGVGFIMTNRDVTRTDKFDVTSFTGDSTPGWDVEIYRNGTLIDTQTVGTDGRYEFNDVPILFGNNVFRILLLGPQGQQEEKIKTINASNAILEPGAFTYNVSTDQKSSRLLDFREFEPAHPDGTRAVAEFEYGVAKWLTATLGGARTFIEDGEHKYVTGGLKTSFLGILSSWDNAYDVSTKSHSSQITSFANYLGTNIRLSQKLAKNFTSEEASNIDNPVKKETALDLDRTLSLPLVGELSTGFLFQRKTFEAGNVETVVRNRLTKNFLGVNFTNTLEQNSTTGSEKSVSGSLSARGILGKNSIGMNADYEVSPVRELSQLKLSVLRNLTPDTLNNLSITRRYGEDIVYELEDAITFDLKKYKLSFLGRVDTAQDMYLGMALNFSLGQFPGDKWRFSSRSMSETGIAVAKSYLDDNYNLAQDKDEKAAHNIPVKIGSRSYTTDVDGFAVAENMDVQGPTYIYADQKQFADQSLGAGVEGYEVQLRPGYPATIGYPLFETSEIEGYIEFPEEITIPKGMKISLINGEGQVVSITNAEFDGYFLFQNVLPGNFRIRIPEDVLKSKNLVAESDSPIVITDDDFFTVNLKFKSATGNFPSLSTVYMVDNSE